MQMVIYMRDNGKMIREMVQEQTYGKMVIYIKESGKMIINMVEEYRRLKEVKSMMVNG